MFPSIIRACRLLGPAVAVGWLSAWLPAQTFQFAPGQLPQGSPFNNSYTEAVDFADVDLDGDMDAANADGGDVGDDQNRLWINLGFAQAGTLGFYQDETALRFPAVLDSSRDLDFVDFDSDGDPDCHSSNHSSIRPQACLFWTNVGGLQGGTPGFFVDETATRWLDLGVNNGSSSCSSMPASQVLGAGGFVDWSGDSAFGDLDGDGDADLLHSSYGPFYGGTVPQRIFLNDGSGRFREYNPSCHQLQAVGITNGAPALWAQGLHIEQTQNSTGLQADVNNSPNGVELGDLDRDYDLDFLVGARNNLTPRLFRNQKTESGQLIWRDVTYSQLVAALPTGADNYEQELGDMDGDGDLDLLGVNWPALNEAAYANNGAGTFGAGIVLPGSGSDDDDADWFDYDADGKLDLFLENFSGQDRLYQGNGSGGFTDVTFGELPGDSTQTKGGDTCDVDQDGDYEVLVANSLNQPNALLLNVGQVPDQVAPSLPHLLQVKDRPAGAPPTQVVVHVYDNSSWDVLRYDDTRLRYRVDGGAIVEVPMAYAGGQLFGGQIPGFLVGHIDYQVVSSDEHGNTGISATKSYISFNATCMPNIASYCTSKISSSGCVPQLTANGYASLGLPDEFTLIARDLEKGQNGLAFFGTTGATSLPFQDGTLCVNPPLYRLSVKNSGGPATCMGSLSYSFGELLSHPQGGALLVAGQVVHAQAWFRDPPAASTTGLTDGVTFVTCP